MRSKQDVRRIEEIVCDVEHDMNPTTLKKIYPCGKEVSAGTMNLCPYEVAKYCKYKK